MNDAPFVVRALSGSDQRASFTCGVEPLDRYLRTQATQDLRRRIAACFVLVECATETIVGYYTLAATSILLADLPNETTKRLPRYPAIPAVLLGRLAVASAWQGRKLGSVLLADAVERAARADIAAFAIVVDPKDQAAFTFYERYGFLALPRPERRMLLPIASALRFLKIESGSPQ